MLYISVLVFHIIVAYVTIATIAYSAYALVRNKLHLYKKLAVAIALLAGVETVSGFSLAALSNISLVTVALHLSWYLGVCLVAESALFMKMRAVWIG